MTLVKPGWARLIGRRATTQDKNEKVTTYKNPGLKKPKIPTAKTHTKLGRKHWLERFGVRWGLIPGSYLALLPKIKPKKTLEKTPRDDAILTTGPQ